MSDSSDSQKTNLEFLRKEAKALLKQCRSGDAAALARLRARLPRLQRLDDVTAAARVKLADVHHAMALERGCVNWATLTREDSALENFLVAVRGGALREAERALASLPDLAEESIHAACAIGDPEAVAQHLDVSPELLIAEHRGWPPLFYACASPLHRVCARQSAGILETARLLLDRGASPNTSASNANTKSDSTLSALQRSLLSANMPVAMLLIARGAERDLNWTPPFGKENPRMVETFQEYFQMPEVQKRIQQSVKDFDQQPDQWGVDRWWYHMRPPDTPPMATPMLRALLERGGLDPNRTGLDGLTTFHRAVRRGPVEVVELFLAHGADIHRATPGGKTALALATREGQNLIVDVLRAHGASGEALTPLDELVGACMRVDETTARTLLVSHPNVLVSAGVEEAELLVHAAEANILPRARLMLECGFNPGAFGEGGFTPLHVAAWHGHLEMVQLLLNHHAPVNVRDRTYGSSPLAWAAHGSRNVRNADATYRRILEALFEAGADYEAAVSRSGVRPEDLASEPIAAFLREL